MKKYQPKYIFYIDADGCFPKLEQQANPLWRHLPMGVVRKPQEFSVISSTSYEAKARGVHTASTTWDAWKICPDMLMVAEDPTKYSYWSGRYWRKIKEFTPDVEVVSVDECYADMTQLVHQKYGGDPELLAVDIQLAMEELVGEWPTFSIGIARSKVMAKMAGEAGKPLGIIRIRDEEIDDWRTRMDVDEVCGIAKGWKWRLNQMGIHKMIDVDDYQLYKLKKIYGRPGLYTGWLCQGRDVMPVQVDDHHRARKGYGHGRVLHKPYPDFEEMLLWLKMICHEGAMRMRQDGVLGRTIHFSVGAVDGPGYSKQYTLPIPIDCEQKIYEACVHIAGLLGITKKPLNYSFVGYHVTQLQRNESMTTPIFEEDRTKTHLMKCLDLINAEWGVLTCYAGWLHDAKDKTWMFKASQTMHRDVEDDLEDEEKNDIDWITVWEELYGHK